MKDGQSQARQKLKLTDNAGIERELGYQSMIASGFYVAGHRGTINNLKKLGIQFDKTLPEDQRQVKLMRFDGGCILTSYWDREYWQYIMFDYLKRRDLNWFLSQSYPEEFHPPFAVSYNLARIERMDKYQFPGLTLSFSN